MRKGQLFNYSASFDGKESDPLSDRTERAHSRCIIVYSDNNMNTVAFPSPKKIAISLETLSLTWLTTAQEHKVIDLRKIFH
jgi:hypothetical protein